MYITYAVRMKIEFLKSNYEFRWKAIGIVDFMFEDREYFVFLIKKYTLQNEFDTKTTS